MILKQNKMITEDFVSFETARLLKEKGFDIYVSSFYDVDGEFSRKEADWNWNIGSRYSAPTLQMAAKWLREVHKLFIFISTWLMHENSVQYYFEIREIKTSDFETLYDYTSEELNSPEKATEVAIKYCLENLI